LRENLDGTVRLADVAQACDLSVSHFARSFKASFGVSCHRWLTETRVERAKELLTATNAPLVVVALQSGFGDQAAFTRTFHRLVGLSLAAGAASTGAHPGREPQHVHESEEDSDGDDDGEEPQRAP